MIKFPKISNGSTFKLGGMQSQSIPSSIGSGKYNLPSGKINLKTDSVAYKTVEGIVDTTKKSENADVSDFEKLTNISNKRPEIISLLNFQPLLNDTGEVTPEGELFDIFVESMKRLDEASAAATQNSDILPADFVKNNNIKFQTEIAEVRRVLQAIYELYRTFLITKKSLAKLDIL